MYETSGQQRSAGVMYVDTKRDVERTAAICLFLNPFSLICIHVSAILISISTEINQQADTPEFAATKHLLRLQKTLFLSERYAVWQPEVVWPRVGQLHCLPWFLTSEPLTPCLLWSMNYSSTGINALAHIAFHPLKVGHTVMPVEIRTEILFLCAISSSPRMLSLPLSFTSPSMYSCLHLWSRNVANMNLWGECWEFFELVESQASPSSFCEAQLQAQKPH